MTAYRAAQESNPRGDDTPLIMFALMGAAGFGAHLMAKDGNLPKSLQASLHTHFPTTYPAFPKGKTAPSTQGQLAASPQGRAPAGSGRGAAPAGAGTGARAAAGTAQPSIWASIAAGLGQLLTVPPAPPAPYEAGVPGQIPHGNQIEYSGPVDLEQWGARGFAWNPLKDAGNVTVISTGEVVGSYANNPTEAALFASTWWNNQQRGTVQGPTYEPQLVTNPDRTFSYEDSPQDNGNGTFSWYYSDGSVETRAY